MRLAVSIPLRARDGTVRAFTVVDPDDRERFGGHRWYLSKTGYATRNERQPSGWRTVRLHRLVLGLADDDPRQVDHINRHRLDNRRANLRAVTAFGNAQNRPSTRESGFPCVYWDKRRQRWEAQGRARGRRYWLGYFDAEVDAAAAVARFRAEHHSGEMALAQWQLPRALTHKDRRSL